MTIPDHILQFWDQRYADNATPWDRGAASPALEQWLQQGALSPCRILVPGCGHGHEVAALAQLGFNVVGVDVAPAAVERLTQRLAEAAVHAEVVCADLLSWQPAAPFDAVYEQTCLCALAPGLWSNYERRLYRWLRSDGQLFALFMQTGQPGGPPYHCEMAQMREVFSHDRWAWPETPAVPVAHPAGIHEFACVLRRRSD